MPATLQKVRSSVAKASETLVTLGLAFDGFSSDVDERTLAISKLIDDTLERLSLALGQLDLLGVELADTEQQAKMLRLARSLMDEVKA